MMDYKYYEVVFDNDYSICILGMRKPTFEEVTNFCAKDIKVLGVKDVIEVVEIPQQEAHNFFDMSNEKEFPVFGA